MGVVAVAWRGWMTAVVHYSQRKTSGERKQYNYGKDRAEHLIG